MERLEKFDGLHRSSGLLRGCHVWLEKLPPHDFYGEFDGRSCKRVLVKIIGE